MDAIKTAIIQQNISTKQLVFGQSHYQYSLDK